MGSCCGPILGSNEHVTTRVIYWYILESFPRLGREPTLFEMEKDLHLPKDFIVRTLRSLEAKGALRLNPVIGRILDVYPYSTVPTRHKVLFDDGSQLYCMCAVDAFYVPFLTGSDVTISSRCFHCRAEIQISVARQMVLTARPATPVVWNSTAPYDCPKTNFFCSKNHIRQWRNKVPDEPGQVYSLEAALEAGRRGANRIRQSNLGLNEILWAAADELVCYCREVPKSTIIAAIERGAKSAEQIAAETTACTGAWCKDTNPKKRCCCVEIEALIEMYSRINNYTPLHGAD
jgi:bacterioferritin-associated ferredoxin